MMSPWYDSGTVTTSSLTGSSSIGFALPSASRSPIADALGYLHNAGVVPKTVDVAGMVELSLREKALQLAGH